MDIPDTLYLIPAPSTKPFLNAGISLDKESGEKELDRMKFYMRDTEEDDIHSLKEPIKYIRKI